MECDGRADGRLDFQASTPYVRVMIDPTARRIEDIAADLEIGEAQAANGETVPLEAALRQLDDTISRMEAGQRDDRQRKLKHLR
jgi:hypothetical protein